MVRTRIIQNPNEMTVYELQLVLAMCAKEGLRAVVHNGKAEWKKEIVENEHC